MKIEVDVLRAEQSWDLSTQRQQNYLVIEVFGIETRVPCSEDELVRAVSLASGGVEAQEDDFAPFTTAEPRAAPATFVTEQTAVAPDEPVPTATARRLAPLKRATQERGDDVGIAQG